MGRDSRAREEKEARDKAEYEKWAASPEGVIALEKLRRQQILDHARQKAVEISEEGRKRAAWKLLEPHIDALMNADPPPTVEAMLVLCDEAENMAYALAANGMTHVIGHGLCAREIGKVVRAKFLAFTAESHEREEKGDPHTPDYKEATEMSFKIALANAIAEVKAARQQYDFIVGANQETEPTQVDDGIDLTNGADGVIVATHRETGTEATGFDAVDVRARLGSALGKAREAVVGVRVDEDGTEWHVGAVTDSENVVLTVESPSEAETRKQLAEGLARVEGAKTGGTTTHIVNVPLAAPAEGGQQFMAVALPSGLAVGGATPGEAREALAQAMPRASEVLGQSVDDMAKDGVKILWQDPEHPSKGWQDWHAVAGESAAPEHPEPCAVAPGEPVPECCGGPAAMLGDVVSQAIANEATEDDTAGAYGSPDAPEAGAETPEAAE